PPVGEGTPVRQNPGEVRSRGKAANTAGCRPLGTVTGRVTGAKSMSMLTRSGVGLAVLVVAASARAAPVPPPTPPKPLPEAVTKAWQEAGAEVGWMGPDDNSDRL